MKQPLGLLRPYLQQLHRQDKSMIYKQCKSCNSTKLLCEFSKSKDALDGRMNICRFCNNKKSKQWIEDNKEKYNEGCRRRYAENPKKKNQTKVWRENNADLMRLYRKKWVENNREKHKENVKNYQLKNPEKTRARSAKWRLLNPEKLKIAEAEFRSRNADKINAKNSSRRAFKLNATPPWLTSIHNMQIKWFYAAAKMMSETSDIKHHVDHIHPLQGDGFNGLHVPWNLRVIKASENIAKHNNLPLEENHLSWEV